MFYYITKIKDITSDSRGSISPTTSQSDAIEGKPSIAIIRNDLENVNTFDEKTSKNSLEQQSTYVDSEGRELTKEQAEYFKDVKKEIASAQAEHNDNKSEKETTLVHSTRVVMTVML